MSEKTALPLEIDWLAWEEDESEQGWLLTYVDVLCVILAMLLVLLVSRLHQPNPEPAANVAAVTEPTVVQAGPEAPAQIPVFQPLPTSLPPPIPLTAVEPVPVSSPAPPDSERSTPPPPPAASLPGGERMIAEGVGVVHHNDGITLQIPDVVLFDSSEAELKPSAIAVLQSALQLIDEFSGAAVAVQGHTDNQPLNGGRYRTNWELAAARANAVAEVLLARAFPAERLRIESYADTRPVADNTTEAGRAKNRRVELLVEFEPSAEN